MGKKSDVYKMRALTGHNPSIRNAECIELLTKKKPKMGYYTELHLKVQLNDNAPMELLQSLADGSMFEKLCTDSFGEVPGMMTVRSTPNIPIEHEFGKSHRWSMIFNPSTTILDNKAKTLEIQCDIKAYDNIYEHLFDWLKPFIVNGTIIKTQGEDEDEWTYHSL